MTRTSPRPAFSRPVDVSGLGTGERIVEIKADADEREALAGRFGLADLACLSASVSISRVRSPGMVCLHARLVADVVQSCVVTLEPVPAHIEDRFELLFAPVETPAAQSEVVVDVLGEDPPEPLVDNIIDAGEIVAEYLALALDSYPRAPDALFEGVTGSEGALDARPQGPFARLRERKSSG
jgi:hypothetical protein